MTQLELLDNQTATIKAQSDHVLRLLAALDNRPQDWEYRDEMDEDKSGKSQCACGHPIVYLFPVYDTKHPNVKRILGSTCINHYATYRPEDAARMLEVQAAHDAKLAEARKAAKRAAAMAEVQALVAVWEPLAARIEGYWERKRQGYRIPEAIYYNHFFKPGRMEHHLENTYTRPCDMIRYVKKEIKSAEYVLSQAQGKVA